MICRTSGSTAAGVSVARGYIDSEVDAAAIIIYNNTIENCVFNQHDFIYLFIV